MPKVRVEMLYYSEDAPGFGAKNDHLLTKTFIFKNLPCIPGYIKVEDGDPIGKISFKNPVYDSHNDTYVVKMGTCEGVSRYYHGEAKEIMAKVMERYKKYGWKCKLLEKQEVR